VPRRRIVLSFGLLTALFAAGYGVMFTVLDDFRDEYGISPTALGLVVAMGFFSSFLAQVFIAPFADRGYARRLVYVGMAFNVVGMVAMAFSTSEIPLFAARLVMGLGAGMAIPAVRRIVILAEPERLGSNLGTLLAADVAGFALGPAISAVLVGPFGIAAPFLVISVLQLACLPVVARVRVDESADGTRSKLALDMLRHRPFVAALLMGAAVFLMIGTFDALWVLVLDDLGAAEWLANIGITFFAVPMLLLASFGGRTAQRVGPFRFGSIGLFGGALAMFLYGQMPSGAAMMAVAMVHSVTDGLTVSSTGIAVGLVAPPERQAGAQGLLGGTQVLVGGLTAVTAGVLYEQFGRTVAYTCCALAMVVLVSLSIWLAGPEWGRRPDPANNEPATAAAH
jgi:MFS transporter, DHA1 family, tetracycline resistance protein